MKYTFPKWHRLYRHRGDQALESAAHKSGLPPGSLVHIGKIHQSSSTITVTQYNSDILLEHTLSSITELSANDQMITWINIEGLSDTGVIAEIGNRFNIHPLVLEDILSTQQRPKLEEHDGYIYMVIKGIRASNGADINIQYEQISILLLADHVITFKEKIDDTFKPIHYHLQNQKNRLRSHGHDYLAYAILDTIVDEYFVVENTLDDIIDPLEDSLFKEPSEQSLHTIQRIRRELISMKRNIAPLRELLNQINHTDTDLLKENTLRFFADVHDHVLRVIDSLESYRERIAAMQDIYLTSLSNKMNETMKVLTVFASIFIPLTFIAGIYGMNFEYMPELKWHWAYPALWLAFIVISIALLLFFKHKKWL